MTENENIEKILYMGVGRSGLENESSIIAKALSELMEYRAIGTVKEIKIREAQFARLSEGYLSDLTSLREYQAIGTIEEFKALKENSNGYSKEDIELNCKAMYNKAIDDFASKLIMHFADWKLSNAPFNDDETDGIGEIICETIENAIGGVEEIAEQLKAGGRE